MIQGGKEWSNCRNSVPEQDGGDGLSGQLGCLAL